MSLGGGGVGLLKGGVGVIKGGAGGSLLLADLPHLSDACSDCLAYP